MNRNPQGMFTPKLLRLLKEAGLPTESAATVPDFFQLEQASAKLLASKRCNGREKSVLVMLTWYSLLKQEESGKAAREEAA